MKESQDAALANAFFRRRRQSREAARAQRHQANQQKSAMLRADCRRLFDTPLITELTNDERQQIRERVNRRFSQRTGPMSW